MKKLIASILMAVTITFSLVTFTPAQASIKSYMNTAGTGKCVDIADGRIDPNSGASIVQFDCHNGLNQKFFIESSDFAGLSTFRSVLDSTFCIGKGSFTGPSISGDRIIM